MEVQDEKLTPKAKTSTNFIPIRIKKATARTLKALIKKLNSKKFGRKVLADDVIKKALSLLDEVHLEEVKTSTYSSEDWIEFQYQDYCKTNGAISRDDFLKLLLEAGLPNLKNSPKI